MKGIAGIVYPDVFQKKNMIHPMLETMKHRSKNHEDVYEYKNIQLGVSGGI